MVRGNNLHIDCGRADEPCVLLLSCLLRLVQALSRSVSLSALLSPPCPLLGHAAFRFPRLCSGMFGCCYEGNNDTAL